MENEQPDGPDYYDGVYIGKMVPKSLWYRSGSRPSKPSENRISEEYKQELERERAKREKEAKGRKPR